MPNDTAESSEVKQLNVRVTKARHDSIDEEHELTGRTKNDIVNMILDSHFDQPFAKRQAFYLAQSRRRRVNPNPTS
jgi:hypothetical protein